MIGSVCRSCDTKFFPTREFCPSCRRKGKIEDLTFSGNGEIYSFTQINVAPEGYELLAPYVLAIVKLAEGPLVTAQIVDSTDKDMAIGKKVRSVFRVIKEDGEEGLIHYGFKFAVDE